MDFSQDGIAYRAYAKVNLGLSVCARRDDGFHEILTVMAAVDLFDDVMVQAAERDISVFCPALPDLPQEQNIVHKAAVESLRDGRPLPGGLCIRVDKRIPVGGGMGGGSSDAAATLLAINGMTSRPRTARVYSAASPTHARSLEDIAKALGSDVPFFLGPNRNPPAWQAALCTGAGEIVRPLRAGRFFLVCAIPARGVNTAWAYAAWDEDNPGRASPPGDERPTKVISAFASGDEASLAKVVYNDLEESVGRRRSDIRIAKEALLRCGALNATMTGSGSAVYGICESLGHAEQVRRDLLSFAEAGAGDPDGLWLKEVRVTRTGV